MEPLETYGPPVPVPFSESTHTWVAAYDWYDGPLSEVLRSLDGGYVYVHWWDTGKNEKRETERIRWLHCLIEKDRLQSLLRGEITIRESIREAKELWLVDSFFTGEVTEDGRRVTGSAAVRVRYDQLSEGDLPPPEGRYNRRPTRDEDEDALLAEGLL